MNTICTCSLPGGPRTVVLPSGPRSDADSPGTFHARNKPDSPWSVCNCSSWEERIFCDESSKTGLYTGRKNANKKFGAISWNPGSKLLVSVLWQIALRNLLHEANGQSLRISGGEVKPSSIMALLKREISQKPKNFLRNAAWRNVLTLPLSWTKCVEAMVCNAIHADSKTNVCKLIYPVLSWFEFYVWEIHTPPTSLGKWWCFPWVSCLNPETEQISLDGSDG